MKKIFIIGMAVSSLWAVGPQSYGTARIPMTVNALERSVFSMGMLPSLVVYTPKFAYGVSVSLIPYDHTVAAGAVSFTLGSDALPMGLGISAGYDYMGSLELATEAGGYNGLISLGSMYAGVTYGISFAEITKGIDIKLGASARYVGQFMVDSMANGVSFDFGAHYTLPLPFGGISKFGVIVAASDVFSLWLAQNMEQIPVTAMAGVFFGIMDDVITVGVNVTDSGSYADLLSFKWLGLNANFGWAIIPDMLNVRLDGDLNFTTFDYAVKVAVAYKMDFGWVGYQFGVEDLGLGHTVTYEDGSSSDRYKPQYNSRDSKVRKSKDQFAKAMVAFSSKQYKEAQALFEEVLKNDPENAVAKSFLGKIKEILSLEE